jgi:hypothetical protein
VSSSSCSSGGATRAYEIWEGTTMGKERPQHPASPSAASVFGHEEGTVVTAPSFASLLACPLPPLLHLDMLVVVTAAGTPPQGGNIHHNDGVRRPAGWRWRWSWPPSRADAASCSSAAVGWQWQWAVVATASSGPDLRDFLVFYSCQKLFAECQNMNIVANRGLQNLVESYRNYKYYSAVIAEAIAFNSMQRRVAKLRPKHY